MKRVGIVVIGRDEGALLERCLRSARALDVPIVYVDSASKDASVATARGLGIHTIVLDADTPLTAARGRNAGLFHLIEVHPELDYVQFVDGDCELIPGWLEHATQQLDGDATRWAVWGTLVERHPERSVYNLICGVEWRYDAEPGEVDSCGGVVLMRADKVAALGGFDATLRAGEEPELCERIRKAGGRIVYIDAAMAHHDAEITSFAQWWRRAKRTGHSYAEGAAKSRAADGARWSGSVRRLVFWGAALPLGIIAFAYPTRGWSLLGLALYAIPCLRSAMRVRRRGASLRESVAYGSFTALDKFPQVLGAASYWLSRNRGVQPPR